MLRIILADAQGRYRRQLRARLEKEPGLEVVAEAASGQEAVRLARERKPDVVLIDVVMTPELNGIDATREIAVALPGVRVIALSNHSDREFVDGMADAGASGYLLKDIAFEELLRAVRTIAAGGAYAGPDTC